MITGRRFALNLAGALLGSPALAQPRGWPQRPLRLVIPFSPGGPTDIVGRRYGEALSRHLGQPVVIDNRAGAAGALGVREAIRAPNDGYTLVLGTSSTHVTTPATMPPPAYDVLRDLSSVALIALVPIVIAVHPSVPARNLGELAALIRADPDRYPYSTAGAGSITHLAGELFKMQGGGLACEHIPYRGSAPAMQDVMAGSVPWFLETFSTTLPQHRDGKLRIIAVCATQRSAIAPDVPSAGEGGFPDLICNTFNIVAGPAGLPEEVLVGLDTATRQVMREAAVQSALQEIGAEPVLEAGPASAVAFLRQEQARWQPVITRIGLTTQ